jgi:hypothetical protein
MVVMIVLSVQQGRTQEEQPQEAVELAKSQRKRPTGTERERASTQVLDQQNPPTTQGQSLLTLPWNSTMGGIRPSTVVVMNHCSITQHSTAQHST